MALLSLIGTHFPGQYAAAISGIPALAEHRPIVDPLAGGRFPHTAATGAGALDGVDGNAGGSGSRDAADTGWRVRIELPKTHGADHRSGEELQGSIVVSRTTAPAKRIKGLVVRCYWTSTSEYVYSYVVRPSERDLRAAKYSKFQGYHDSSLGKTQVVTKRGVEWHRGFCEGGEGVEIWRGGELEEIRRVVEGDFPLLEGEAPEEQDHAVPETLSPDGTTTLPFSFVLPTKSRSTSANPAPGAPPNRFAFRSFLRSPPPSLNRDSALVEWVVEAILAVDDGPSPSDAAVATDAPPTDELPPMFGSTLDGTSSDLDAYGHLQSSSTLVVERVVFPFSPHDAHTQDLYSSWDVLPPSSLAQIVGVRNGIPLEEQFDSPEERREVAPSVPSFGRDPRDESLGGSRVGGRRVLRGTAVERAGGRAMWSTYEKVLPIRARFKTTGYLRSQVSLPFPPLVACYAASLPILVHLDFFSATGSQSQKPKTAPVNKITVILNRRQITRGGTEARPQMVIAELRRQDFAINRSVVLGEEGVEVQLDFELQTGGLSPSGKELVSLRDCGLSFRTPNIEYEYLISLTISTRDTTFYALRSPLQLIAGDHDDAPVFEATPATALPPAFDAPDFSSRVTASAAPPETPESNGLPGYAR